MALNQASFAHDIPGLLTRPINTTTRRIFVAATRQNDDKTTTSLGLFGALLSLGHNVSYIKPVAQRIVEVENGVEVEKQIPVSATSGLIPVCVMLVSAVVMIICGLLMRKPKLRWLSEYALPISLILGMASAIPITAWLG